MLVAGVGEAIAVDVLVHQNVARDGAVAEIVDDDEKPVRRAADFHFVGGEAQAIDDDHVGRREKGRGQEFGLQRVRRMRTEAVGDEQPDGRATRLKRARECRGAGQMAHADLRPAIDDEVDGDGHRVSDFTSDAALATFCPASGTLLSLSGTIVAALGKDLLFEDCPCTKLSPHRLQSRLRWARVQRILVRGLAQRRRDTGKPEAALASVRKTHARVRLRRPMSAAMASAGSTRRSGGMSLGWRRPASSSLRSGARVKAAPSLR